jgi:meso-butanediol dehydrogenase/(S,S)-butanediol dehydrogenase/diacetyl reductase
VSVAIQCDVADPTQIDAAADATVERFGSVDIRVNAAHSNSRLGPLFDIPDEAIEWLWSTGPPATLRSIRRCRPHLLDGGAIINVGSGTQRTTSRYGDYAGMEDAICAISRAAAVEWGAQNIRVNVIAPPGGSPSMDSDLADAGGQAALVNRVSLRRVGDPEHDVGRVVVVLASEDSSYVTGQLLMVDGGNPYHR